MWMGSETFYSLLHPAWPLHYRFLRLIVHTLRLLSPLRLHCCRQRRWKTCRLCLRRARLSRRSFRCHHHQRNPRRLTSLCSLATRYLRLQTRHRRLPNLHRLRFSRRLQRLGRPQFRLRLRDFNTNTTGISATSAENTIIKSHISTAGFFITNKIFLFVYSPQQGGLCASLVPVYMCVYTKSNKNIQEKKNFLC
jgi:hypothetical protein